MSVSIATAVEAISELYSPLSADCKKDMEHRVRLFTADKQQLLVKEGQYSDKTFYIIEGTVRAYYLKDGKDITDWFAFENEFISSIDSFFLQTASDLYIEVLVPAVLIEVTRTDMLLLCDKHPCFDRLCRMIVTRTMLQLKQRITSIQFEPALQRYERLIQLRPDITQRIPLGHIASYLGITRETLSRIRKPVKRI